MKREDVLEQIKIQKPQIVYVSGKTCTGKTTFANEVHALGYQGIELDKIVASAVVEPFNVQPPNEAYITAYKDMGPAEHVAAFIAAVKKEIDMKISSAPIVIEGAIARSRILKEIFSGELRDFFFVYFHPIHFEPYKERIRSRFIAGVPTNTAGLPKNFWTLVNKSDLDIFLQTLIPNEGIEKAIDDYVGISMRGSEKRLRHFKEAFPNLHVVEV